MKIIDIEIIKAPIPKENRIEGYQYVDSWDDLQNMGISVMCYYDYNSNVYGYYAELDFKHDEGRNLIQEFLSEDDIICGFNIRKFDCPLLEANGFNINYDKVYDLLLQIWFASGLTNQYEPKTHGGYSLNAVVKANFVNIQKTGNGADAPLMWQDGKYQEVIDYCMNDVKITKMLIDRVFADGGLISPKTKKMIKIAIPGGV